MLARVYEQDGESLLPYTINAYPDNVLAIGEAIKAVETNSTSITNGWMVDIFTLTDLNGNEYHHAIIDEEGEDIVFCNNQSIHYLSGGTDGDTSDEMFEDLFRQFMSTQLVPEIIDTNHYPITHVYDVGFSLTTKYAMCDWIANHSKSKIVLSTQDSSKDLYTMDESVSVASALKARCALTPESTLYGTEACRAEIFGQAGYLNDTSYKSIVPASYWMCMRRSSLQNSTYLKGTVKGYPNNRISIYRKENFVPYSPTQKQTFWDNAANYFQYANMTTKFYPDIRTIYRYESSVLSDTTFTDCCIYTMYIVDEVWTYYVGKTQSINTLFSSIKKDIEAAAYNAFGDTFTLTATPYQTDEDLEAGDQCHIDTILLGYTPLRRWFNTIIARRENYNSSTE